MMNTESPVRSLPTQFVVGATAHPTEVRTKFCTSTGWHAYRDLTPKMRRAILSADGGVGSIGGWVSTHIVNKLLAMGLVERSGFRVWLTYHGELLWCELDD